MIHRDYISFCDKYNTMCFILDNVIVEYHIKPIYYNDKIVRYLLPGEDAPDNTEPVTDENGYIKQFIIPDYSIKDVSKQMKIKPMKRKLYIDFNSF